MSKLEMNKGNIVTRSKGCLKRHLKDDEGDFCEVILTQDHLIILSDDFARKGQCLYNIPQDKIVEFSLINKIETNKEIKEVALSTVIGLFTLLFSGLGYIRKKKSEDLLSLKFWDADLVMQEYIINMMDHGERGLTAAFNRK